MIFKSLFLYENTLLVHLTWGGGGGGGGEGK